jgi:hypothetical protein
LIGSTERSIPVEDCSGCFCPVEQDKRKAAAAMQTKRLDRRRVQRESDLRWRCFIIPRVVPELNNQYRPTGTRRHIAATVSVKPL